MEQFFCNPETLMRLRQGQFGPYLNSFAKSLVDEGYARETVRVQIKLIGDFARWLKRKSVVVNAITTEHANDYVHYRGRKKVLGRSDRAALKRLLHLLRSEGRIAVEMPGSTPPAVQMAEKYVHYLREECGLAKATIIWYRVFVLHFLTDRFAGAQIDLSHLSAADILTFVQRQAAVLHVQRAKLLTTALRSFFRFARYQDYISIDLAAAVPAVAQWSMSSIPKSLPRDQVELVLSSCDRRTAIGRRDYAILLLLARLGVRAGEIVSLRLEDIDWQAGRIAIHGKSEHRSQLPLVTDVGAALAEYLSDGRPRTNCRFVFLRSRAPVRGFKSPSAVSNVVLRALVRAGIDAPRRGAHQFRHSLATEMLRQGASLSEIGELLGHRSPDTTAIYAKVDLVSLRSVALPWPGGMQ